MTDERIIEEIISRHPETSAEAILQRLEMEKRKTGGLISDEALLRMIAAEFGVSLGQDKALAPSILTADLVPGLSNVTVVGRVVGVSASKAFRGDRSGKMASLLVADRSGVLRVVLWNDKTSLVESGDIKVGQMIRFSHGYTREDRSGKAELQIGDKSEIEINLQDVEARDYPTIRSFTTKIKEIAQVHKNKRINTRGKVEELFPASEFKRQDTSSGKLMRFVLADEKAEIPVVVWNEKVDELEKTLMKGANLRIINATVKKTLGEGLEIHVDARAYVEELAPEEELLSVADLKDGLSSVNILGEIVTKPIPRDVKTSRGELVKLVVFELKDHTGRVWVSTWRKHADTTSRLKIGDRIIIRNAYVKRGFADQLELSTRDATSIELHPEKECE
jgi:replication factor A1